MNDIASQIESFKAETSKQLEMLDRSQYRVYDLEPHRKIYYLLGDLAGKVTELRNRVKALELDGTLDCASARELRIDIKIFFDDTATQIRAARPGR